jgi:hypothetical protein
MNGGRGLIAKGLQIAKYLSVAIATTVKTQPQDTIFFNGYHTYGKIIMYLK